MGSKICRTDALFNLFGIPSDSKKNAVDIISDLLVTAQKMIVGDAYVSHNMHKHFLTFQISTDVHRPTVIVKYNLPLVIESEQNEAMLINFDTEDENMINEKRNSPINLMSSPKTHKVLSETLEIVSDDKEFVSSVLLETSDLLVSTRDGIKDDEIKMPNNSLRNDLNVIDLSKKVKSKYIFLDEYDDEKHFSHTDNFSSLNINQDSSDVDGSTSSCNTNDDFSDTSKDKENKYSYDFITCDVRKYKETVNNFALEEQKPQENKINEIPKKRSRKRRTKKKATDVQKGEVLLHALQQNTVGLGSDVNKQQSTVNSKDTNRKVDDKQPFKVLENSEDKNKLGNSLLKIKEDANSDDNLNSGIDNKSLHVNILPADRVSEEGMQHGIAACETIRSISSDAGFLVQVDSVNNCTNYCAKDVNRSISHLGDNSESYLENFVTDHPSSFSNDENVSKSCNDIKESLALNNSMQNVGNYLCKYCNKAFSEITSKEDHETSHVSKIFSCSFCKMTFHDFTSKDQHEIAHIKEKICSSSPWKPYLSHFSNEIQIKTHTAEDKNTFVCNICGKTFPQLSSKNDHEASHSKNQLQHECKHCKKMFASANAKRDHEKTHVNNQQFKCRYCVKQFAKESARNQHEVSDHLNLFPCKYCGKSFSQLTAKEQHEMSHVQKLSFTCSACQQSFPSQSAKDQHYKDAHPNSYPCKYCGKSFSQLTAKEQHEMSHVQKLSFTCSACQQCFPSQSAKDQHYKDAHPNSYPCKYCGKSFSQLTAKEQHEMSHVQKLSFTCSACQQSFPSQSAKDQHYKDAHPSSYPCKYCGKSFSQLTAKEQHEMSHVQKLSFTCSACQQSFPSQSAKDQHYKDAHPSSYPCKYCGKSFSQLTAKEQHEMSHVQKLSFTCSACQQSFPSQSAKDQHYKDAHTSSYPCKYCGKSFSQLTAKEQHEKSHIRLPSFSCSVCQQSFGSQSAKDQHYRDVHTKLFSCDHCGKSFSHLSSKEHHEMSHVQQQYFSCTLCQQSFATQSAKQQHDADIHLNSYWMDKYMY